MKSHWAAGNIKMRGKKHKLLSCTCCECQDFRDKVKEQDQVKQIKEFKEKKYSIEA